MYFSFLNIAGRKSIIILLLIFLSVIAISATNTSEDKPVNLKVLPKDISNADLDSIMETYEKQLNVSCDFCHAESKVNKNELDYSSDDKPEKEITRQMMRMTAAINKDYFDYTIVYKAGEEMAVSCFTCHDGFARPEMKHEKKQ